MEEVVYQFLLQTAGYPRSALVGDASVLFPSSDSPPAFTIVDPQTVQPLAVVRVVGGVDAAGLYAASAAAEIDANSLGAGSTLGFVVRVDYKGKTSNEKMQFYRAKDNGEVYPLTASTFPDLDTLRVRAKLANPNRRKTDGSRAHLGNSIEHKPLSDAELLGVEEMPAKRERSVILLGTLLILLALADVVLTRVTGTPLLQVSQVLLIVGAVLTFALS